MASQERQHADDTDRVLIRPSNCSTLVVKKSSVGHVPYEPSKGAIGRDVCHSAVPAASSTAAHGGHRATARTNESRQKHTLPSRLSECSGVSPVVQSDVTPLSLSSQGQLFDVTTTNSSSQSTVGHYRASSDHLSHADIAQTLKSVCLRESSSAVSFGDLAEDNSNTGLFPRTSLNHTQTINTDHSAPSSTSDNVQMLETEVVSLKEQLVIQSKVCLCCLVLRLLTDSIS